MSKTLTRTPHGPAEIVAGFVVIPMLTRFGTTEYFAEDPDEPDPETALPTVFCQSATRDYAARACRRRARARVVSAAAAADAAWAAGDGAAWVAERKAQRADLDELTEVQR